MFKYMSADVAPLFAKTLKVRFTQPSDVNDPFEFRPLIDFQATAAETLPEIDAKLTEMFGTVDGALTMLVKQKAADPNFPLHFPIEVARNEIAANPFLARQFMEEVQRHKTELLNDLRTSTMWEDQWNKFHQALGESFGIFSLTEDPLRTMMWSHYASQHAGIVVEFDENNSWFDQKRTPADEFRHLVRVTYVENPQPRTWKQLNGTDWLYTKNAEWASEREWRIIRPLKDGAEVSPGIYCFDVPPAAVLGVIFGCRTTPAVEEEVRACIAAKPDLGHVHFRRAKLGGVKIEVVDCP